jgi:hypothetical protein
LSKSLLQSSITTRGPQSGYRAGGSRPCSRSRSPCSNHQSPPAALSQGIARTAVDHVVVVEVLAPITTRGPQSGYRAGGSRPCSRSRSTCSNHQLPPAALSQGIARTAVDHVVVNSVNLLRILLNRKMFSSTIT